MKYLKDADDFDISLTSYCSDVLLDEGKAQVDASDQRVTVNVVSEQGRRVREGSVAVGSQLEDPRYQLQLEQTSRPPVPTFPRLPSSLGKRPLPLANDTNSSLNGAKRARHIDIPETHLEEQEQDLVSSIEHDEAPGSIELVHGTQYSNAGQQTLDVSKDRSSELRRSLHNVASVVADELEELPAQPPNLVSNRGKETSANANSPFRLNKQYQPLPSPTQTAQQFLKLVRGPITPPSETSGKRSNPTSVQQQQRSEDATKSAAQLSSASSNKFKRNDVYDYPESDIDDSQMSPRSKAGQSSHRKPKDQLSRIESLESPEDDRREDRGLTISQAIDSLEEGSDFEDDRPVDHAFRTREGASRKARSDSAEVITVSVYEDPETRNSDDAEQNDDTPSLRASSKAASDGPRTNSDEGSEPPKPASTRTTQQKGLPEKKAAAKDIKTIKDNRASSRPSSETVQTESKKRKRKRNSGSVDGESVVNESDNGFTYSEAANATKSTSKGEKLVKKAKGSRASLSLDSPGEQLSQSLQRSTEELPLKAVNKKLANQQKKPQSETPGKKNKTLAVQNSSQKTTKGPKGVGPDGQGQKQAAAGHASSSQPNIILQSAEQEVHSSPALTKPLPNWSSDTPSAPTKKKLGTSSKEESLSVGQHEDSRKSPSVGVGLTAEELKTMESRVHMTKEEYEADKKRKQQEAKKQAKQAKAGKKNSVTENAALEKAPNAKEAHAEGHKPAAVSTKNKACKSPSSEEGSNASLPRSATDSSIVTSDTGESKPSAKASTSGKAKAMRGESTGASSSQASEADSMPPPKTPAKTAAKRTSVTSASTSKTTKLPQQSKAETTPIPAPSKSSSVQSVASSKTPKPTSQTKPSSQQSNADKTPKTVTKKPAPSGSTSTKLDPKSAGKPQVKAPQSTRPYDQRLSDLKKTIHDKNKAPKVNKGSLLSQIKQTQTPSGFQLDDDDEEEDSESSDDEEEKPKTSTKVAAKLVATTTRKKPALEDDDEETSSEEEENAKNKKGINCRSLPLSASAKEKASGLPDPSIRDKSIESDENEDEDED